MTAQIARTGSVAGNAGWSAVATLVNIAIAFLLAPLLIGRLGVDQWGLLLLVWSVAGVLSLANFGLGEATLRYVAHYHADGDLAGVNRVFGATLTFYVLVCLLVSVAVWAATPVVARWVKVPEGEHYHVPSLLRATTALFSIGMISNAFQAIPMAIHRYDISSGVGLLQSIVRSAGLVLLALLGAGILHLVVWEVLTTLIGLVVRVLIARRLIPGLKWLPSLSLAGMREVLGYSVFSFLTHVFLMVYRDGGRLILGNRLGTASVAYLGTPDSVANRLHMVIVSAIETLMPRFSASRDAENTDALLTISTWIAFACVAVVYVPLAVLMPDFLRLWINADFAARSGDVGRLLSLGLVGSVAFSPIATLFRGQGKPGFVTAVMASVGAVVLAGSLALIPTAGVLAVGYAYAVSALVWIMGLGVGWYRLHGPASLRRLARIAGLPLAVAAGLYSAELALRAWWGPPGWVGFLLMGSAFAVVGGATVVGVDLLAGGSSPAALVVTRMLSSRHAAGPRA